jgi:hypothetical protein
LRVNVALHAREAETFARGLPRGCGTRSRTCWLRIMVRALSRSVCVV